MPQPAPYQPARVLRKSIRPSLVVILATTLLLIGAIWFFSSILPVLLVEARYQVLRGYQAVFGTRSVSELFFPSRLFDLRGASENTQYGIVIPALYLDEPVVFNVDPNNRNEYSTALQQGIAHASSTGFPGSGQTGYYFAHSSHPDVKNQFNAVFYLLGKLKSGDEVFIWHAGERFEYTVTETRITKASDVSFLSESFPQETIVLQTCWPIGTTQERLLVFAQRAEGKSLE